MLIYPVLSCLINFSFCKIIQKKKAQNESKISKNWMIIAIVCNILSLCIFKYLPVKNLFVPLGISFITFGQIAYVVDSYNGLTKEDRLEEYLLYIMWFPKVTQGPLLKHDSFMAAIRSNKLTTFNYENVSEGFFFFVIGLFKKMFIADNIATAVNYALAFPDNLGTKTVLLIIFGYTLQIYMDFSGYSDMAVGISKAFNIDIPINFNSPYKAESVSDFWKRWHISLTDFLREYIYFPLGGSKKGKARTYINIIIVYAISGLWHGSGITFLLWGLLHGVCQVIERAFKKGFEKIPRFIRIVSTFLIVNIGWLLFRVDSLKTFVTCIKSLFKADDYIVREQTALKSNLFGMNDLLIRFGSIGQLVKSCTSVIILLIGLAICFFLPNLYEKKRKYTILLALFTSVLFVFELLSLSGAMTTFIYFNF